MTPLPAFELDWNLVRTFVAVAKGGSLAEAARQLGLAHPTVARHIQVLEQALGLVLFDRTSHGLTLNLDGRRLADQAELMQGEAIAFRRLADTVRELPPAQVRITSSELVMELLPAMLRQSVAASGVPAVELIVADEQLNLLERQADIAVRHVQPVQQDLICRRVGALSVLPCASSAYLKCFGPVRSKRPAGHRFVDSTTQSYFQQAAGAAGFHFADQQIVFRSNSVVAQRVAMLNGWGIAALPASMLDELPEVVRLFDGQVEVAIEVWLVARPEIRNARQVKAVYDALGDALVARLECNGSVRVTTTAR